MRIVILNDFAHVEGGASQVALSSARALAERGGQSLACLSTQCDNRMYAHKLWRVARQWTQEHRGHLPRGLQDFISISDVSERVLQPYLPANARIHRVSNPVAVPHEPPTHPGKHATFSFVGRLSAEKGPQLLAACAAKHHLPVRFIGEGRNELC